MNEIFNQFETFTFVFIRTVSIFITLPFFGSRSVPIMLKTGMALLIAFVVTPLLGSSISLPGTDIGLVLAVMKEILIGVSIGLTVRFIFSAIEMAGQLTGMQMGFAVANVIDPQTSSQLSVVAQFYNLVGILLFFSMNVHLVFISAIKESFLYIPPYSFTLTPGVLGGVLGVAGMIFKIGVKLAAPITVAILLANIAMGIVARTVPQMNIFVVGFPVTIVLGLLMLGFSLPFIVSTISKIYINLSSDAIALMKAGGG